MKQKHLEISKEFNKLGNTRTSLRPIDFRLLTASVSTQQVRQTHHKDGY